MDNNSIWQSLSLDVAINMNLKATETASISGNGIIMGETSK
jgi:hypothetical protein